MVTSDLGACEWFVWDLRRSGLIDRGQLDQIVGEFLKRNPRAEAPALAEYLVDQGTLTAFQAERVLNGKTPGARARAVRPARRHRLRQHGPGLQGQLEERQRTSTRSRCCRGGACGTSASPAGRSGRSAASATRRSCRSWTSAPPAACTTSSGRSSRGRRSRRSSSRTGKLAAEPGGAVRACRSPRG